MKIFTDGDTLNFKNLNQSHNDLTTGASDSARGNEWDCFTVRSVKWLNLITIEKKKKNLRIINGKTIHKTIPTICCIRHVITNRNTKTRKFSLNLLRENLLHMLNLKWIKIWYIHSFYIFHALYRFKVSFSIICHIINTLLNSKQFPISCPFFRQEPTQSKLEYKYLIRKNIKYTLSIHILREFL